MKTLNEIQDELGAERMLRVYHNGNNLYQSLPSKSHLRDEGYSRFMERYIREMYKQYCERIDRTREIRAICNPHKNEKEAKKNGNFKGRSTSI